jgi:hypothetical protein
MGQELALEEARAFAADSERRFGTRARDALVAFAAGLDVPIAGAGMVAAPAKSLPPLEKILKSHAMVHAAEGELYRRVFAEASAALGAPPARVPAAALAHRAAAAAGLSPAKLAAHLAAMGKASGKPWAADQKQAALVAWLALAVSDQKT